MVKSKQSQNNKTSPRLNLPIKLIIFWYKRLSAYINSKKFDVINKEDCPKIFISKKYPQMSILELYQRIDHHLIKYFPHIHSKLNSNNNKESLINIKKEPKKETEENNNIKNINDEQKTNNLTENINPEETNEHTKKIKLSNEKYCYKINKLFKEHKFSDEIYEKYNNCSVKEILIKNEDNPLKLNNIDNISPTKSISTSSTKSYGNKVTYLTHSQNITYKKPKYFNNDDYYIKKLSEIQNKNNEMIK